MNYEKAAKHMEGFVSRFFFCRVDPRYCFHHIQQTEYVLRAALGIAKSFRLSKREIFLLTAAAWFQNTGYYRGETEHEERSCDLGADFLKNNKIPPADVTQICGLILSTRPGHEPAAVLEKILADANYYYFGRRSFAKWNERLYKEHQFLQADGFLSMEAWQKEMIQVMSAHRFHTTYCRLKLAIQKEINMKTLVQQKMNEADDKSSTMMEDVLLSKPETIKKKKTEKGVDTMFKISSSNSQRLSSMADNKAHILITVNSIILSAIISLVIRKLDADTYLIIPTIIILGVSLSSMIFAILVTRPDISKGTFRARDLANENINLLFFGNFYKMPLEEYEKGMIQMMGSSEFLYKALIRDVHTQGGVLGRKYRQLRLAYNIFMFGLIIAVCAFLLTAIWHAQRSHS